MKIELREITIRELVEGYKDSEETGVVAYGGRLDVRPPYQREFRYDGAQRAAVIDTIFKGFPLNVMYWAVRADGTYEMIDGQQRTISICQYVASVYSVTRNGMPMYFHNLKDEEAQPVLDYKLMVYFCTGTEVEKLEWFRTINIAGERLTEQELRNAVYAGTWVSAARKLFSKNGCPAYKIGKDYVNGTPIKQEILQTVLKWQSKGNIEEFMGEHQFDPDAQPMWDYFEGVIGWVKQTFPKYRKEMKGVDWGALHSNFGTATLDPAKLEKRIAKLMADSDVTKKAGIYPYVLDGKESHLSIRIFDDNTIREVFERQKGKCPKCGKTFKIEQMEADHITPWSKGGRTIASNCQMLCKECNRLKSDK